MWAEHRHRPACPAHACMQVEVLIELRAMALERMGKMDRHAPLAVLEAVK